MLDYYVDLSRRLANLIRAGTVAEVDTAAARVRIQTGELLTQWLPFMAMRAGETATWCPPTVGEYVLILSPSGETEAGIVITGINTNKNPSPSTDPNHHITKYPDGAEVVYDHSSSTLYATGLKNAILSASTICSIDCPQVVISGNFVVNAGVAKESEQINIGCKSFNVACQDAITLDSPATTLKGNVHIDGNLTVDGSYPD